MKLEIYGDEFWIKDDIELPSDFDSMNDNEKWDYICKNKLIHKKDGPAIIYSEGSKYWYLHGELHRTNGPAIITSNGYEFWCLNGIEVEEEIYKKIQNSSKGDLLVYMINYEYKDYISLIEYRLSL